MHQVQLRDICYFEAVDNRVFAYLDTKVFEIHSKLYELEQQYGNADFFRVSKSVIVKFIKRSIILVQCFKDAWMPA